MIDIQFKFKHDPALIRNQYVLAAHYMHGDADGYTSKEHQYDDSPEHLELLKNDILAIITMTKFGADFDEATETIAPVYEAQGIEDAYKLAEGWADDFYEGDITCDGVAAALQGFDLVFYDDSGDKFDVEIYFNDKLVE